jgi:hypothetical protein
MTTPQALRTRITTSPLQWERYDEQAQRSTHTMTSLKTFSPAHLTEDAKQSGFFQWPTCGLIWFGRPDIAQCPQGSHGRPVTLPCCVELVTLLSRSSGSPYILPTEHMR